MRIRRCANLWLEPREVPHFDLDDLLTGGTGQVHAVQWIAHAAHLDAPVAVDAGDVELLRAASPNAWMDAVPLRASHGALRVRRMLRAGLLVATSKRWQAHHDADAGVRSQRWHGLAAAWHAASRWQGVAAAGASEAAGLDSSRGLRRRLGAAPPIAQERGDAATAIALERRPRTPFDELLDARTTCRNFDTAAELALADLSRLLERAFGARGRVDAAEGVDVLKKTSPSGGALHPTECYLIARRVCGLPRGLYHYRPVEHALRPLPYDGSAIDSAGGADPIDALALVAVGGQPWFADAHALCVLAPRFTRNFWKYRDHAKAYRVCILDVGHLSQTFQLCATEAGLGSYVTAAINEVDIERAFGLAHWSEGPLAICGVGLRADTMRTGELDPNGKAWARA